MDIIVEGVGGFDAVTGAAQGPAIAEALGRIGSAPSAALVVRFEGDYELSTLIPLGADDHELATLET